MAWRRGSRYSSRRPQGLNAIKFIAVMLVLTIQNVTEMLYRGPGDPDMDRSGPALRDRHSRLSSRKL